MNLTVPQEEKNRSTLFFQEGQEPTHLIFSSSSFLDFALDSALAVVNAYAGSLFVWDEAKKALVFKTARGPYRDRLRDAHVRLREGIAGWVGDQGQSLLVTNGSQDNRLSGLRKAGQYESDSFISLPLIASNKLLGVLNITERASLIPFTEEDHGKVRLFVQHVAIAYDNMKISERLNADNLQLQEKLAHVEETVRLQEPLVAVGKLAANIAHELNNPLDSIRRYVNLALDQVMEDSLSRQYILKAKDGIRRAVYVIRGLLQYSRESARVERREGDIHEIIHRSIDCVSNDHRFQEIELVLNLHPEPLYVMDGGLNVVLRNLIRNAHYAMQGHGKLRVSTGLDAETVIVEVEDNGCGMTDAVKNRLFEPFFTTKENEGTGIGLTICRDVVHKCGGEITCESTAGKGTKFIMRLPLRRRG